MQTTLKNLLLNINLLEHVPKHNISELLHQTEQIQKNLSRCLRKYICFSKCTKTNYSVH